MKNLFIFNIGNSDVQLKSNPVEKSMHEHKEKRLRAAREEGRKLLEEYNQFEDDTSVKKAAEVIELSIIKNFLELNEFSPQDSKIILFVTDQEKKHDQDTIYYGKIVKRILESVYEFADIETIAINANPSDIDIMMNFYNNALKKIAEENKSADCFFASLTGGVPAQNTALLLCGLEIFADRFRTLYKPLDSNAKVKEQSIAKNLIKNEVKKQISLLVRQGDYHAALEILSQNSRLFETNTQDAEKYPLPIPYQVLQNLLKYAHSRQVFDFKKAQSSISSCLNYSHENREYFNELESQVRNLHGNNLLCIAELKENAKHLYNAGHYVDFLGRIFRFFEAVCDYVLLETRNECRAFLRRNGTHVIVRVRYANKGKDFIDFIIKNFAEASGYVDANNEINEKLNNILRLYLITYIDNSSGNGCLSDYMYVLITLSRLRNKTIMSHGFKGISSEEIENQLTDSYNKLKTELQNDPGKDLLKKRCEIFEKVLMKEVSGKKVPDICGFLDAAWEQFIEYADISRKTKFKPELFYRELPRKIEDILEAL